MKWGIFVGAIIGLLSLYILFYYFIYEGFQADVGARNNYLSALRGDKGSTRAANIIDQEKVCSAVMATVALGTNQGKPDIDGTINKCADCLAISGCGWAPITGGATGIGACIPRNGQYPISPQFLVDYLQTSVHTGSPKAFNTNSFVYSVNQCVGSCSTITNCKDCVSGKSICSWSLDSGSSGGSGGMCIDAGSTTSGSRYIGGGQSAKCPLPACSTITDCVQCSQQTGCGYCISSAKCISVDSNGNDSSSGSTICSQGNIATQGYQCPCEGITDCATCAARPGCGFCGGTVQADPRGGSSTAKCKNLLDYTSGREIYIRENGADGTPVGNINNLCPPDGFRTSAAQCSATLIANVRSESSDYKPGADELNMTEDNTALWGKNINLATQGGSVIGTGSGAVSAAKTWSTVSGNGVVVGPNTRVPNAMWNSGDLYANPLESYVKLLVRSEMASEGIPVNEPFQVNEADAVGNASDYMKKVFRGVFS